MSLLVCGSMLRAGAGARPNASLKTSRCAGRRRARRRRQVVAGSRPRAIRRRARASHLLAAVDRPVLERARQTPDRRVLRRRQTAGRRRGRRRRRARPAVRGDLEPGDLPSARRAPRSGRRDPDRSIRGAHVLRPVGHGRRDAAVFCRTSIPPQPAGRTRAGRRSPHSARACTSTASASCRGRRRGRAAVGSGRRREAQSPGTVRARCCSKATADVSPTSTTCWRTSTRRRWRSRSSRRSATGGACEPFKRLAALAQPRFRRVGRRRPRRSSGRPDALAAFFARLRMRRSGGESTAGVAGILAARVRRMPVRSTRSPAANAVDARADAIALAEMLLGHPARERERRVDLFAFAERVFAGRPSDEADDDRRPSAVSDRSPC